MTYAKFTSAEIRALGDMVAMAGEKIISVANEMDKKNFGYLVIQASSATTIYGPALLNLGANMESEFKDQYDAERFKRVPRWEFHSRKIEAAVARKKAKKERISASTHGIEADLFKDEPEEAPPKKVPAKKVPGGKSSKKPKK